MTEAAAQRAYLQAWHDAQPGATTRAFAAGRIAGGGSSYDLLVQAARGRVLDLGCGDGLLVERIAGAVGVDLSAGELALAARRPGVAGRLVRARADALPIATASIDTVVSHLASMLMTPADAVAGEIARVLAPGGRFVAVVGGGPVEPPPPGDAFAAFLELVRPAMVALAVPRLGDPRSRSEAGLRALLGPYGLEVVGFARHVVELGGAWGPVAEALLSTYGVERLTHEAREALATALHAQVGDAPRCAMVVFLVTATAA